MGRMAADDLRPETIERWALSYLARYASSAENLRRVLRRRLRRCSPAAADPLLQAAIEAVIARHRDSGLLDDDAYAEARARSLHRRGRSAYQIRARLLVKGVAPAVAAAAVAKLRGETADLDLRAACAFARRRRLGPFRRGAVDRARELGAFARAGFARRVAEAVLGCADVSAAEALARGGLD
jgi:regulatory protein